MLTGFLELGISCSLVHQSFGNLRNRRCRDLDLSVPPTSRLSPGGFPTVGVLSKK